MDQPLNVQHRELAAGRWATLSFCEQMANVGSEVHRALNWRRKGRADYAQRACQRALELLGFTIAGQSEFPRLKELTRLRECLVDFFLGNNEYRSTDASWQRYFLPFNYAARKAAAKA